MAEKLQLVTRRGFGFVNRARLSRALVSALQASVSSCEACREIEKDVEFLPDGGEYVEAASFPGKTIQKLDAHFKAHWKDDYRFVDLGAIKASP